jgi:hypothetical protein
VASGEERRRRSPSRTLRHLYHRSPAMFELPESNTDPIRGGHRTERVPQQGGPCHGERGTLACQEGDCPAGIPHENGPTLLPARHDDLRDDVVIRLLGTQFKEPVNSTTESGELPAQPFPDAVLSSIPARGRIAIHEERGHLVGAEAVESGHPVDGIGKHETVPVAGIEPGIPNDERSRAHAQGTQVLLFGSEDVGTHFGMDSVSPDENICGEHLPRRAVDGGTRPAVVRPGPGDPGAVADVDPAGGDVPACCQGRSRSGRRRLSTFPPASLANWP